MYKILKNLSLICLILLVLVQINLIFAEQNKDTLVQLSTIDALMNGLYDGFITVSDALKYGNTGIGTFEGLDGEMISLNGKMYQIPIDGNPKEVKPDQQIPFMILTYFKTDQESNSIYRKTALDFR